MMITIFFTFFFSCRKASVNYRKMMSPRGSVARPSVHSAGMSTENTSSELSTPYIEPNNNIKTQADIAADKIIHPPVLNQSRKCLKLEAHCRNVAVVAAVMYFLRSFMFIVSFYRNTH